MLAIRLKSVITICAIGSCGIFDCGATPSVKAHHSKGSEANRKDAAVARVERTYKVPKTFLELAGLPKLTPGYTATEFGGHPPETTFAYVPREDVILAIGPEEFQKQVQEYIRKIWELERERVRKKSSK